MRNGLPIIVLLLISSTKLFSQDTLVVYDSKTKGISFILPVSYNLDITSDRTLPAVGSLEKPVVLSAVPPVANLYPGAQFSQLAPASSFFSVDKYPVRTAVSIQMYKKGELLDMGSGTLIGENIVLTAAHVIYDYMSQEENLWYSDSLVVIPAFDNGITHPNLPVSMVSKRYIFKNFYDYKSWPDIALLELETPIGRKTGWVGMAFNEDTSFFRNKVFHKFSYPGTFDWDSQPPREYNSDTLYYNYGLTIQIPAYGRYNLLGVKNGRAVPGQSGSSLFCEIGGQYYSFGVLNWSTEMMHYQIHNKIFYQFKNVMENYITVPPTPEEPQNPASIHFSPNPFYNSATLFLPNPTKETHALILTNLQGKTVRRFENISAQEFKVERGNLAGGMYFYQIWKAGKLLKKGKIVAQ